MEPDRAAEYGQAPIPAPPATGEPRVDAALRTLSSINGLPISEHPGVFERVHSQLVEVLGEVRTDNPQQ